MTIFFSILSFLTVSFDNLFFHSKSMNKIRWLLSLYVNKFLYILFNVPWFFYRFLLDLECNSSYVYEGESAKIGCNLNTTSFVSINVTKLNSTIASILADGSVTVYPEYQGKLTAVLSLTSLLLDITFSSVTCSDSDMYTIEMYLSSGNVTFTTCKVVMKGETLYF